jgi:eukaryotic-like serine/threonine-protein kinase
MLEVTMQVLDGAAAATPLTFKGTEPTNILVGRDDPKCEADWRLGKGDRYISRNHFMLEVRPPNCLLRDPLSLNGTYLRRGDRPEERIEEVLLEDGDQIRVGHTVLGVTVVRPVYRPDPFISEEGRLIDSIAEDAGLRTLLEEADDEPLEEPQEVPAPAEEPEMMCIRCGGAITHSPALAGGSLRDVDFMCSTCQEKVRAEQKRRAAKPKAARYRCQTCGTDVSSRADGDGRAPDLQGVCYYLCETCADKARRSGKLESDDPLRNRTVNGWRVLRKLGQGGMGVVYQVWHTETGRIAALKRLLPIPHVPERTMRRFHREMSIMQDLHHPNLVRLFEGGQLDDAPFFVSEFVTGGDLTQFISDEGRPLLSPGEVAQLMADSLVGLNHFHMREDPSARKYVHRDIKPENILVTKENGAMVPKVADFGLAKCYEESGGTTTRTGEYAGTIMYMPPEQIASFKAAMPPVDLYAMGVTTYYLLTGQMPLEFPPPWQITKLGGGIRLKRDPIKMVLYDTRRPIRGHRSDLPLSLCRVVDKAVIREADSRFQTADGLREALLSAVR